jgi:hypothetical protein
MELRWWEQECGYGHAHHNATSTRATTNRTVNVKTELDWFRVILELLPTQSTGSVTGEGELRLDAQASMAF